MMVKFEKELKQVQYIFFYSFRIRRDFMAFKRLKMYTRFSFLCGFLPINYSIN